MREAAPGAVGLAVVDPDTEVRSRLAHQLAGRATVATYPGLPEFAEQPNPGRPTLVIFGPGLADSAGLAQIERFSRSRPEVGAILLAPELSTALLHQALRAGVRDVLGFPADTETLGESIDRVAEAFPSLPPASPAAPTASDQGKIVTVFSMKGGSGKTVVATNLAVVLAQQSPGPVVLVDADLQFGDVTVVIRLAPPHTIVDVVSVIDGLDADLLRSHLVVHEESGLLVLPAPLEPAMADAVTPADMLRILEVLRSFCSYIVVDTPSQFNDVLLAVLDASDEIVVIAGMEIPNIKNAKLGLQTLRRLGIPESRLRLLVNRSNTKVNLDIGEIEQTLGLQTEAQIPSDVAVPRAINRGVPVVLEAPRSDIARSFERLAGLFHGAAAERPAKKARGRFGR